MAEYTQNYNLYKPSRNDTDPIDTTLTNNFQTIDEEIKKRETDIANLTSNFESTTTELDTKIDSESLNLKEQLDTKTTMLQNQVDSLVIDGDSSPAIAQALAGSPYSTLKEKHDAVDLKLDGAANDLFHRGINVRTPPYNAPADGLSHPLSERFATLEEAQKIFPAATALTDEIDWAAIQTALNTRNPVFLPSGNFVIHDTLKYYSKQEIYGVGDSSNIISNVSGKPVMTNAEAFFNTNFHKFRIQGNGNELNGIEMLNPYEHMYISYVSIVGVGGNGLHLVNTYGLSTIGLHIIGTGKTTYGVYASGSNGVTIKDALIKSCSQGIHANWTYNFTVTNSIIESNNGTGIYVIRGNSFLISQCYFENNAILKEVDNNYDIYLGEDSTVIGSNNFMVKDSYFRSTNTLNVIKIKAKVKGGTLSDLYILGFEQPGQQYMYDIDLLNDGYIKTFGIDSLKMNKNNQEHLIHVNNDVIPVKTDKPIKLQYMDGTTGTTVAGEIPCVINYHHVQTGGLTQVNFEITGINLTDIPTTRLVTISLPIKRSVYGGFFTAPLDFNYTTADPEVLGIYGAINNVGYMVIKKIGTTANPTNRFDVANLTNLTALRGSIIYY